MAQLVQMVERDSDGPDSHCDQILSLSDDGTHSSEVINYNFIGHWAQRPLLPVMYARHGSECLELTNSL